MPISTYRGILSPRAESRPGICRRASPTDDGARIELSTFEAHLSHSELSPISRQCVLWPGVQSNCSRSPADRRQIHARGTSKELPQFVQLWLPNDHTGGTRAAKPAPRASIADNDLAVGRVVDAVSHSAFETVADRRGRSELFT